MNFVRVWVCAFRRFHEEANRSLNGQRESNLSVFFGLLLNI